MVRSPPRSGQWRRVTAPCDVVSLVATSASVNTWRVTARSTGFTEATQGRLRRLNLASSVPPLVIAAAIIVFVDAHAWWHVLVLVPGVVVALVAFERWTTDDLARVAAPQLRVAALGALLSGSGTLPQFHREIPWASPVITRAKELERGNWGAGAAAEAVARTVTAAIVSNVVLAASLRPQQ